MPSNQKRRSIHLKGVRQNNLKNIEVDFPFKKLSVITGVSGSGKSSLAFETLYAEGQRRYIESLSTYTRQFLEKMPKPEVDTVQNIPPAIALEQRNHVLNSRSTVGTQTEIVDYLRLLFARVGTTVCVKCHGKVQKIDAETILDQALNWFPGRKGAILAPFRLTSSEDSSPSKSRKKNQKKNKKTTTKAAPRRISGKQTEYFKLLVEQGFRRLVWRKSPKRFELFDLEDQIPPVEVFEKGQSFVVIDRLKLGKKIDNENRARLFDSIGQALRVGSDRIAFVDLDTWSIKELDCRYACLKCGTEHPFPEPQLFSFNSPLGACPKCSGFGFTLDLDESRIVPNPQNTLKNGAIDPLSKPSLKKWQDDLFRFAERHNISIGKRYAELNKKQKELLWNGHPQDSTFPGIVQCFEMMAKKKYKLHVRVFIRRYQSQSLCTECNGARLNPHALAVKVRKKSIAEILELSVDDAHQWFGDLKFSESEAKIAESLETQIHRRLHFLHAVGVGYLTLDRMAKSLSGGEFQRITLATQLGNGLCGTLYVLDEPSIGLHAADTERLVGVLKDLRDQGNSVVVVEHDLSVIENADYVVELGPNAGRRGGEIIAAGTPQQICKAKGSLTGKYLRGDFWIDPNTHTRPPARHQLRLTGCRSNNLKKINAEFPLERFVVVTGVSGSGKSTLVHKTLYHALKPLFADATPMSVVESSVSGQFDRLYGADHLSGVVLLDQKPIGKSSRSNPATYLKAWDEVRRVFANQVLALRRGYTPQHFSFNVDGGRCPTCKGEGEVTLDMHFMADVTIPCDECSGKRFKKNVLEILYKGKNVFQILETTIDEAYDLFRDNVILVRKLGILRDVGLGYLKLGQSAPTLSGGESQRLKIAATLEQNLRENQLFLFDEPTTGLHNDDVKKLLGVIQDLVAAKNSVIMIEHHLDVIAQADWVLDLGPGGGKNGGELVACGSPLDLMKNQNSITGKMLLKTFPQLRVKLPDSGRLSEQLTP